MFLLLLILSLLVGTVVPGPVSRAETAASRDVTTVFQLAQEDSWQDVNLTGMSCEDRKNSSWITLQLTSSSLAAFPACLPELLETLDLSNNLLAELNGTEIASLPQLRTLLLRQNHLQAVRWGSEALSSLHSLDLSFNKLSAVPSCHSSSLPNLRWLSLAGNPLMEIQPLAFSCFPRLQFLNLSATLLGQDDSKGIRESAFAISTFPQEAGTRPENIINVLDLSGTFLEKIEPEWASDLLNLRSLHLTKMSRLRSLDTDFIKSMSHLRELNCQDSHSLGFVKTEIFENAPHLKHLSFQNCNLTSFSSWNISSSDSIIINLHGNPLSCDCGLSWLLSKREEVVLQKASDTFCNTSQEDWGRPSTSFSLLELHDKCQSERNITLPDANTPHPEDIAFSATSYDATSVASATDSAPAAVAASTTDSAPAAVAASTTDSVPAAEVASTTDSAPAAEVASTTDSAPAAEVASTTDSAPAAEVASTTDSAPAAEVASTTDSAPAAEVASTTDSAPAAEVASTTDSAPAAVAASTTDSAPAAVVASTTDSAPAAVVASTTDSAPTAIAASTTDSASPLKSTSSSSLIPRNARGPTAARPAEQILTEVSSSSGQEEAAPDPTSSLPSMVSVTAPPGFLQELHSHSSASSSTSDGEIDGKQYRAAHTGFPQEGRFNQSISDYLTGATADPEASNHYIPSLSAGPGEGTAQTNLPQPNSTKTNAQPNPAFTRTLIHYVDDYDYNDQMTETPAQPAYISCDYNPCRHLQKPCSELQSASQCLCPGISREDEVPDPPRLRDVSEVTDSSAQIHWCAPNSVVHTYQLMLHPQGSEEEQVVLDNIYSTARQYTLYNLLPYTTYHICVTALNKAGSSQTASQEVSSNPCTKFKTKLSYKSIFAALAAASGLFLISTIVLSICLCKAQKKPPSEQFGTHLVSYKNPAFDYPLKLQTTN